MDGVVCVCVCVCVTPVIEVLSNDEVFEVVVNGPLVVVQEGVGVAQAVAGLSLHRPVLQLSSQLQRLPEQQNTHTPHTPSDTVTSEGLLLTLALRGLHRLSNKLKFDSHSLKSCNPSSSSLITVLYE